MSSASKRTVARTKQGSAIAETGPALCILFLFLFFPLLDLISIPMSYCSCATLNDLQLREAVNLPRSQALDSSGLVKKKIPDAWRTAGIGQFVSLTEDPKTDISYKDGQSDSNGVQDKYVIVTTTLVSRPFLTMPFFFGVPGMTMPMTCSITTRRLLENPGNFNS